MYYAPNTYYVLILLLRFLVIKREIYAEVLKSKTTLLQSNVIEVYSYEDIQLMFSIFQAI